MIQSFIHPLIVEEAPVPGVDLSAPTDFQMEQDPPMYGASEEELSRIAASRQRPDMYGVSEEELTRIAASRQR